MILRTRLTLTAALAVALSTAALVPLFADQRWVLRILGAVLVVAVAAIAAQRLNVFPLLQPVIEASALAGYTAVLFVPHTFQAGLLATPTTALRLHELVTTGFTDIGRLPAPVPSTPGLVLLAVLGVGVITILVINIAAIGHRPTVAGLPLLVLLAIPSGVRSGGVGWLPFALGAGGWLAMLRVEGAERARRWSGEAPASTVARPGTDRLGRRIGATALGLALVLPAALPGLDARLFSKAHGDGTGSASRNGRSSTTYNPITQLRGQLNQPEPMDILRYTTTDPQPDYLRLTTLDTFDGSGWSASQLHGDPERDAVQAGIALPATLDASRTTAIKDRITILSLATKWLPLPFLPTSVRLNGPWVWDRSAETAFSALDDTRDLHQPYEVTATRVIVAPGSLSATGARPREIARYADPLALTPYVAGEVRTATAGAETDFAKVQAIQQYFHDANRFSYSTNADAPALGTTDALELFLRHGRGFCEQYASAMAAMVRSLALPARVAVGFTAGTKAADGSYLVTTRDAHAWPEVWFAGTGWLRFEPTPRRDVATIPRYAEPQTALVPSPDAPGRPSAGPDRSAVPVGERPGQQGDSGGSAGGAAVVAADKTGGPGLPSARQAALGLVLLCLPVPALTALLRRRRRLRTSAALDAWAQLHDDATDLGHRWRLTDSPRAAALHLQTVRELDAPATAALTRLSRAVEQARYGRPDAATGTALGFARDARTVRAALRRSTPPAQRWRAVLLPPATLAWLGASLGGRTADLLDALDNGLSRLDRTLRRRMSTRRKRRPEVR